jgi:hypothetical protein
VGTLAVLFTIEIANELLAHGCCKSSPITEEVSGLFTDFKALTNIVATSLPPVQMTSQL